MSNDTGATARVTRTHGGMPVWGFLGIGHDGERLRFYWPYTSDIDGRRFLTRFIVFRNRFCGLDVTRIHMPDDGKREWPHDHSRDFWSFKAGWYSEWVHSNPEDLSARRLRRHSRFSIHRLRHTEAHSITEVSPGLVTVMFLGPRRQGSSYWTPWGKRTTGMKVDEDG